MAATNRISRLTFEVPPGTQFAYPNDDIIDGLWKNEIGVNTNLFESVNEPSTPVDTDWIQSAADPIDDYCQLGFSNLATPTTGTVTLRIRAKWVEVT